MSGKNELPIYTLLVILTVRIETIPHIETDKNSKYSIGKDNIIRILGTKKVAL